MPDPQTAFAVFVAFFVAIFTVLVLCLCVTAHGPEADMAGADEGAFVAHAQSFSSEA